MFLFQLFDYQLNNVIFAYMGGGKVLYIKHLEKKSADIPQTEAASERPAFVV